jgi:transposase
MGAPPPGGRSVLARGVLRGSGKRRTSLSFCSTLVLPEQSRPRVIDLLPDREAATFAAWLGAHGGAGVEVISRDRSGAFAEGARQAAPQALQVADRFHLLQNLGTGLDRLLTREHRVLTRVAQGSPKSRSARALS